MLLKPNPNRPLTKCRVCNEPMDSGVYGNRKYDSRKCARIAYETKLELKSAPERGAYRARKLKLKKINYLTKLRDKLVISAGEIQTRLLEVQGKLDELNNQ